MSQPRQRRKSQATKLPANHPGDREPTLPVRPTRAGLLAILRQAADPGQPIRVDLTPDETGSYQQQLVTLPGWRLLIMFRHGAISHLSQAWGPGGSHWDYGCDRWPDWAAESDGVAFCPIKHMLTELERAALEARLLAAPCDPPAPIPKGEASMDYLFDQEFGLFTA